MRKHGQKFFNCVIREQEEQKEQKENDRGQTGVEKICTLSMENKFVIYSDSAAGKNLSRSF